MLIKLVVSSLLLSSWAMPDRPPQLSDAYSESCGYEDCKSMPCTCETQTAWPLLDFFLSWFLPPEKCNCISRCARQPPIVCMHGICNKLVGKCECEPCWTGTNCDSKVLLPHLSFGSRSLGVRIKLPSPVNSTVAHLKLLDRETFGATVNSCEDVVFFIASASTDARKLFWVDPIEGIIKTTAWLLQEGNFTLSISVAFNFSAWHVEDTAVVNITVYDEVSNQEETITDKHEIKSPSQTNRRSRRAVPVSPLSISINPQLSSCCHLTALDKMDIEVKVYHTGSPTTYVVRDIEFLAYSTTNHITGNMKGTFDNVITSGQNVTFTRNSLASQVEVAGTLYTTLRNETLPLQPITVFAVLTSAVIDNITVEAVAKGYTSPYIYATCPKIIFRSGNDSVVNLMSSAQIEIEFILPALTYLDVYFDASTEVNDLNFISITGFDVWVSQGLTYVGLGATVLTKSTVNDNTEHAMIHADSIVSTTANASIRVNLTIDLLGHHGFLFNNPTSIHKVAIGVRSHGGYFAMTDRFYLTVNKANHGRLNVRWSSPGVAPNSEAYFFVGDVIAIDLHFDTGEVPFTGILDYANISVKYSFDKRYLQVDSEHSYGWNGARTWGYFYYLLPDSDKTDPGNTRIAVKIMDAVLPFQQLPLVIEVTCAKAGNLSYPCLDVPNTTLEIGTVVSGQPEIRVGTHEARPVRSGESLVVNITILLTKVQMDLSVYLLTSTHPFATMHVNSFELVQIGMNIEGHNSTAKATYTTSNESPYINDAAEMHIGSVRNFNNDAADDENNWICLRAIFTVLDISPPNRSAMKNVLNPTVVVVSPPYFAWSHSIFRNLTYRETPMPRALLNLTLKIVGDGPSEFQVETNISHSFDSEVHALGVRLTYLLPVYLEFLETSNNASDFVRSNSSDLKFLLRHTLYFHLTTTHKIAVKLKNTLLAQTSSRIPLLVHFILEYSDRFGVSYHSMASDSKMISVSARQRTILDAPRSPPYYDRGFFWEKTSGTVYFCIDEHLSRLKSACYKSSDNSSRTWTAMDARIGSVTMRNDTGEVIGLARDGRSYFRYDATVDIWHHMTQSNLTSQLKGFATEIPGAVNVLGNSSVPYTVENKGSFWGGNDSGLYFKPLADAPWILKARWRCCN